MNVESKAWDWGKNQSSKWTSPSEISYYLLHRWKAKGFTRFLDLGCGLGRHSFQFAEAGFRTLSFDLSADVIGKIGAKARELGLPIEATRGDMKELPYETDGVDCLLAFHVISHTDSRGIAVILDEIRRVVRDGGEIYVTLCSKNSWSFKDAGYRRIDDNTVLKEEDGPENGIPHFFADDESVAPLFRGVRIESLQLTQDRVIDGEATGSWHYFVLGINEKNAG